jgi:hypothetical protein
LLTTNCYLLQKKITSNAASTGTSTTLTTPPTPKTAAVQAAAAAASVASAAKKAKLKGNKNKRAKLRSMSAAGATGGHVLGGADYVDIMMGSRRREREEAMKLPRDTESPPRT